MSALAAAASSSFAQTSWTDPVTTTPSFIQKSFGPYGSHLPGNGEQYCGPTAIAMELYWLGANGFSQIAPASYDPANPTDVAQAANLISILGGLADTSATGGTFVSGLQTAVKTYFAAEGISASQFTYLQTGTATADWFSTQLALNKVADPTSITFTNLLVGWYRESGTVPDYYVRSGGHFVDVVDATTGSDASITDYNPYPSSFATVPNIPGSNPQTVSVTNLPSGWTLDFLGGDSSQYQQIQSGTKLGDDSNSKGILQIGQSWSVSTSALPTGTDYQVSGWSIVTTQTMNTNSGTLSVIAPLSGTGGFYKTGLGSLILTSSNDLTGANYVDGGSLESTVNAGTPFGTGAIFGYGSAVLNIAPVDSSPSAVNLTVASGSGSRLSVDNGGLVIGLAKGNNTSLKVTLGGNTDGTTPNLTRSDAANLELAPDAGLSALGNTIQLQIAGSGSNLPSVKNGMVAPWIVGIDNDAQRSGAFLDYVSGTGFIVAATTKSSQADINGPDVSGSTVYQADTNVSVTSASAAVYALSVDGFNVSGSNDLSVGDQNSGDASGVILNGGTISTSGLQFGGAEADVYTSTAGGVISSVISGSGGFVKFGSGALLLSADNGSTLSGVVSINNGTLIAGNSAGSATGSGYVYIESEAILQINAGANVSGPVVARNSGILIMNGGTASGSVTIPGRSGVQPGGTLQGAGTIAGPATVGGTIQAGSQTGIIYFTGNANLSGASFYWQLNSLVDNSDSSGGLGWNALDFSGSTLLGTTDNKLTIYVDPSLVDGPDGSNVFWNLSHIWTIFTIAGPPWNGSATIGNYSFDDGTFSFVWFGNTGTSGGLNLVYTPVAVPEPAVWMLLVIGGVLLAVRWKRRRRALLD